MLKNITTGLKRALRCWKWILVYWLISALSVSMILVSFKTSVRKIIGSSLITERLAAGFPADVIVNSGTGLDSVLSSIVPGAFLVLLVTLLTNAFFTGGLFSAVRSGSDTDARNFFGSAAYFFRKFLGIYLLTFTVLFILALLLVAVPSAIGYNYIGDKILYISFAVYFAASVLVIAAADFSRAIIIEEGNPGFFKAVGSGIKSFSAAFINNYSAIILILIIQVLFACMFVLFIARPLNFQGKGLMIIAAGHIFFIIKVFLRCWRYGTVTSITESQSPGI